MLAQRTEIVPLSIARLIVLEPFFIDGKAPPVIKIKYLVRFTVLFREIAINGAQGVKNDETGQTMV